jgi:hypothetical protein
VRTSYEEESNGANDTHGERGSVAIRVDCEVARCGVDILGSVVCHCDCLGLVGCYTDQLCYIWEFGRWDVERGQMVVRLITLVVVGETRRRP